MTEPSCLRATRASCDTVAVDYAEFLGTEFAAKPYDRAMPAAFAEHPPLIGSQSGGQAVLLSALATQRADGCSHSAASRAPVVRCGSGMVRGPCDVACHAAEHDSVER
ncbi:hypothetical protein FBY35_1467 [Streptomyces sp. SLBN-118]|nr:hypothetical protein FBY35_1467 [Streptomyces sp. SLBN-118]